MTSFIEVQFAGREVDTSLEATIHRWVARMAAIHIDIFHVIARVERAGWRGNTRITLQVSLGDQTRKVAEGKHSDAHLAISDAFRALRLQVVPPQASRALRLAH